MKYHIMINEYLLKELYGKNKTEKLNNLNQKRQ